MPLRIVGRVAEIWKYPISSLGGERVACATFTQEGMERDREFGLIDASNSQPAAPERELRWRKALHLQSRGSDGKLPTILFPDDQLYELDNSSLNAALTEYFGLAVAIASHSIAAWPAGFPFAHYRHRHFPLHLLTTTSLEHLAGLSQLSELDSRRFRPSVLVELWNGIGFAEDAWISRSIRIGEVEFFVHEETKRCGVTFVSQPGLQEDPEVLRSILRHNGRTLFFDAIF